MIVKSKESPELGLLGFVRHLTPFTVTLTLPYAFVVPLTIGTPVGSSASCKPPPNVREPKDPGVSSLMPSERLTVCPKPNLPRLIVRDCAASAFILGTKISITKRLRTVK